MKCILSVYKGFQRNHQNAFRGLASEMVNEVYNAKRLLDKHQDNVWFGLVLGIRHEVKELNPLVSSLKTNLISFRTKCRVYDKTIQKYNFAIIAYVAHSVRKDQNVSHQMVAAADSAGQIFALASKTMYNNCGRDKRLLEHFGTNCESPGYILLNAHSRGTCNFLQEFSKQIAVRKSDAIFASDIKSTIQKRFSNALARNSSLSWPAVKAMIRN